MKTSEIKKRQQIRLLIAGTHSGVGKTTVTIGLARCFKRRGLSVQCFKIGPDYLDAALLTRSIERPCYNIDRWLTGEKYLDALIKKTSTDILLFEGVMGMFDHQEIASYITSYKIKPILIFSATGMGQSAAALVNGFATFDDKVSLYGVIANDCRTARHREILKDAIEKKVKKGADQTPFFLGSLSRNEDLRLPTRHLGIQIEPTQAIPQLSKIEREIEKQIDLTHFIELGTEEEKERQKEYLPKISEKMAEKNYSFPVNQSQEPRTLHIGQPSRVLAYAWDEAFYFYYPDNLELLAAAGFEIVPFSPLRSLSLPKRTALVYIGGGYPESHCRELEKNTRLLRELRTAAPAIYGECGGLMYLSQGITDLKGKTWEMIGLLPIQTEMLAKFDKLNYVEVQLQKHCLIGEENWTARGHEYHYSRICYPPSKEKKYDRDKQTHLTSIIQKEQQNKLNDKIKEKYLLQERRTNNTRREGFQIENTLGSYVHLHFGSQPKIPEYLYEKFCKPKTPRNGNRNSQ